ncbi:hypothetical protein [Rhodopirellula baltica]|uniref:hypothetical protein n=1 Tax=Rhodopirellula baltica TaxID=265606 RepID=UPI0026B1843D
MSSQEHRSTACNHCQVEPGLRSVARWSPTESSEVVAKCKFATFPVGHVVHGVRADALEESEARFVCYRKSIAHRHATIARWNLAYVLRVDSEAFLKRLQVGCHGLEVLRHERWIAMVEVFFVQ